MSCKHHRALIAGTHSGAGKTVWSLFLMRLAKKKGLSVQPFKAGPDYIDPRFHNEIARPFQSRNLDFFLMSSEQNRFYFARHAAGADVSLVEGMMGLFDGKNNSEIEGSSAHLAMELDLPVLLVLDGAGLATSAAAVVLGFKNFHPGVKLAGVLMNRVSGASHFNWLKAAIETRTGVRCLGYLPQDADLAIPERHLGLTTAVELKNHLPRLQQALDQYAGLLDWDRFLKVTEAAKPTASLKETHDSEHGLRIGVAFDEAFSFYYEDNFDLLREEGADLIFFSPLNDPALPSHLDLLYLGGGFPELYARKLADNRRLIEAVRRFYADGGFIYGECGGLIFLTEGFEDGEGCLHALAGIVPGKIQMTGRLQHFGYHELETASDTFLFERSARLRSHEFHYSRWLCGQAVHPAYWIDGRAEGVVMDRLVASYQHLHFGCRTEMVRRLIRWIRPARSETVSKR